MLVRALRNAAHDEASEADHAAVADVLIEANRGAGSGDEAANARRVAERFGRALRVVIESGTPWRDALAAFVKILGAGSLIGDADDLELFPTARANPTTLRIAEASLRRVLPATPVKGLRVSGAAFSHPPA